MSNDSKQNKTTRSECSVRPIERTHKLREAIIYFYNLFEKSFGEHIGFPTIITLLCRSYRFMNLNGKKDLMLTAFSPDFSH